MRLPLIHPLFFSGAHAVLALKMYPGGSILGSMGHAKWRDPRNIKRFLLEVLVALNVSPALSFLPSSVTLRLLPLVHARCWRPTRRKHRAGMHFHDDFKY